MYGHGLVQSIMSGSLMLILVSQMLLPDLAIQGPKSEDLAAEICGNWVRKLKYFWFRHAEIEGIPFL